MLDEGEEFYLHAFWELDTCRAFGMGIGPIPWTTMVTYAQFHQLDDDVAQAFVQVIREMDAVYLAWEAERIKAERESNNSPGDPHGS